jgi:Leucine-rich repeat (LRR) protein
MSKQAKCLWKHPMERSSVLHLIAQAAAGQSDILNLSRRELSEFPPEIGDLTNLTSLYLTGNQLNTLPESIGNLTNLTSLSLGFNRLNTLPESIGNLTNLTSLDLGHNKLNALPESIGNLTNLTFLNLSSTRLNILPESIGNLTNLICLFIGDQLNILPESIGNLTDLTSLHLHSNKLNVLPESIWRLNDLTSLYLSANNLNILPESIGNLTNLTSLHLHSNKLNVLPESIWNLTNLTSLNLGFNKLTALPKSIGQLTNLTSLDLSYNKLIALPKAIAQLNQLRELILNDNKLSTLPLELTQLTQLKKLNIKNNNLIELPPEVKRKYTQPGPVFKFLRQLQEEGSARIYEAKPLTIGESGSGKTNPANKLIDSNYSFNLEGDFTQSPEFYRKQASSRAAYEDMLEITKLAVSREIIVKQEQTMTNESKFLNDLKGANIGNFANEVKDSARQQSNQNNYAAQPQSLTDAAKDIKALIDQFSEDYDTTTQSGKMRLSGKVLESVEQNPNLKSRTINALKGASKTAFEEAIDHPIAKVLIAGLEGFIE